MLLAMYGLRCSEVANLKLSDIDWRKEQIYIKRAKNCRPQILPLLHNVGEAIIDYLKMADLMKLIVIVCSFVPLHQYDLSLVMP